MHIEIGQATQSVASNKRRKLLPPEVDWILNKVAYRYLGLHAGNLRDNPGAADSLTHLNRIQTVLGVRPLPAFALGTDQTFAVMPHTVAELLSVEVCVNNLCGAPKETLREQKLLHVLRLKPTTASSNFYENVTLTLNGNTMFDMQAHTQARNRTFTGFPSATELWRIAEMLLVELGNQGYNVYFETYNGRYFPQSIIFSELPSTTINLTIDGTTTTAVEQTLLVTSYLEKNKIWVPGRLHFQTRLPGMRSSAFADTYYRSPLCHLTDNVVQVDLDKSFTVSDMRLHFLRNMRRIDLDLGQDCELPEGVHPDICDLATEYIKVLREDPDWEVKLRDNMIRTTI